eukprot:2477726-Rhodomonas_salina.1
MMLLTRAMLLPGCCSASSLADSFSRGHVPYLPTPVLVTCSISLRLFWSRALSPYAHLGTCRTCIRYGRALCTGAFCTGALCTEKGCGLYHCQLVESYVSKLFALSYSIASIGLLPTPSPVLTSHVDALASIPCYKTCYAQRGTEPGYVAHSNTRTARQGATCTAGTRSIISCTASLTASAGPLPPLKPLNCSTLLPVRGTPRHGTNLLTVLMPSTDPSPAWYSGVLLAVGRPDGRLFSQTKVPESNAFRHDLRAPCARDGFISIWFGFRRLCYETRGTEMVYGGTAGRELDPHGHA